MAITGGTPAAGVPGQSGGFYQVYWLTSQFQMIAFSETATGLAPGTYYVLVYDANFCSGFVAVTIGSGADTEAPVFDNCLTSALNAGTNQGCTAVLNLNIPSVSDNCGSVSYGISYAAGAAAPAFLPTAGTLSANGGAYTEVFGVGTTVVTLTATDAANNSNTCTFEVTVSDDDAPTALCRDITVDLDATGVATIVAADVDNGSSDHCGAVTLSIDRTSFDCTELGAQTVILTATDAQGLTAICSATVTVRDVTAPDASLVCGQTVDVFLDNTGQVTLSIADFPGVTDACGTGNITAAFAGDVTYDCSDVGNTYSVAATFTDPAGNATTCNVSVLVNSPITNSVSCGSLITLEIGSDGTTFLDASIFNDAQDPCNPVTVSFFGNLNYNCSHVGAAPTSVFAFFVTPFGSNFCEVFVEVTDPNGHCAAPLAIDPTAPEGALPHTIVEDKQLATEEELISVISPDGLLMTAFPNPVQTETTIKLSVDRATTGTLYVTDLTGRRVATLADNEVFVGERNVRWNPDYQLNNGIYWIVFASERAYPRAVRVQLMR